MNSKLALSMAKGNLLVARDALKDVELKIRQIEKDYITKRGIVNPDGSIPADLSDIEDDTTFEHAIKNLKPYVDQYDLQALTVSVLQCEIAFIDAAFRNIPENQKMELKELYRYATKNKVYRDHIISVLMKMEI